MANIFQELEISKNFREASGEQISNRPNPTKSGKIVIRLLHTRYEEIGSFFNVYLLNY